VPSNKTTFYFATAKRFGHQHNCRNVKPFLNKRQSYSAVSERTGSERPTNTTEMHDFKKPLGSAAVPSNDTRVLLHKFGEAAYNKAASCPLRRK